MFTNRIFNHVTASLLTTMLLLNSVVASGFSACDCSSVYVNNSKCCCQNMEQEEGCCCQEAESENASSCCQSEESLESCQCGCQHQRPVPDLPSESSQNRLQIELSQVTNSSLSILSLTSNVGIKVYSSSKPASTTLHSVQVLCCTWLT